MLTVPQQEVGRVGTRHSQVWFGTSQRPLYGVLSFPCSLSARGGVVLCGPMGEEGRASVRTFRRLAESLADAGLVALRLDYDGTGDSAGLQDDPDRVASWLGSIRAARSYLGGLGVKRVSAVGMRLGATLAGCQAVAGDGFDSLVLWDPCVSGRTFLREGQALYSFGEVEAGVEDGYRHTPGFQYDAATASSLRGIDLSRLSPDSSLASRILLLRREDRPTSDAVLSRVQQDAGTLTLEPALDQDRLLDLPPSDNFVPERTLARVVQWLVDGTGHPTAVREPPQEHAVELASAGPGSVLVSERVVRLGKIGLYGIADEPLPTTQDPGPRPWVVLINSAAENHLGPGRRWVEFARQWAGMGYRCIRVDPSGIGDSPTHPGQIEDTAFAPEWLDDMRHLVDELSRDGSPVAMIGLCSGAYSSFEAALGGRVAGVLAINPRLTLYPAAKGSPNYSEQRRAAQLPVRPIARLAVEHRILAGALWRIYRQFACWHAPTLVLAKVVARGTTVRVISCRMDAREFTEVALVRPRLWRLRRDPRFTLDVDDVYDHSLLGRRGQQATYERATEFVREMNA